MRLVQSAFYGIGGAVVEMPWDALESLLLADSKHRL
jgi:hypothetical protein